MKLSLINKAKIIPRYRNQINIINILYIIYSSLCNKKFNNALRLNEDTLVSSARDALYLIIKALNLPLGSGVGIPLMCCTTMFESIIELGYQPIYIDLNPNTFRVDLNDLSNKIKEINCLVIVNIFGIPNDLNEIRKVTGDGVIIIEDCAHSYFKNSNSFENGLWDFQIYSFNLHKPISAGGGGLIRFNINQNRKMAMYKDYIEDFINKCQEDNFYYCLRQVFKFYIKAKLYQKPIYGVWRFSNIDKLREQIVNTELNLRRTTTTKLNERIQFKVSKFQKFLINIQLKNVIKHVEKNRQIAEEICELFNDVTQFRTIYPNIVGWDCYALPVICKTMELRNKFRTCLLNNAIDTSINFTDNDETASKYYYYQRDCKKTEEVFRRLLLIPIDPNFKEYELKQLLRGVKLSIDEVLR